MVKKYRKLLGYIGPFRKRRFWLVVLCAASILIGSIMPFFIGKLVNMVTVSAPIADILKFGALLIIIGLLDATLNSTQNYIWHMYSTEYLNYFRTIMLQAALKKNVKFFKENDEDFTNRILHDTSILSYDISIGFPMLILNVLRIGIVVVLMFYMSPILTILPLLIVPIYTFTFHRIDKKIRTASNKERQLFTRVSETVKEYLNGVLQIKINGKEKFFLDNFKNTINEYTDSAKDIKKYTAISYGVGGFTKALLPIVVLISGAILIIKGQLTLGYLFAFYSYLDFLYEPMTNLSDWYTGINVSLGMSDRVLSFLEDDMEEETGEKISDFYFSVKKKISGLVQIIFGIAVILQVYFATLLIFDLIGLSNMPDIHNLSTFEGLNNFKFVFLSLAFSIVTYFIRSHVEKGEYDLRTTIDARM